MVENGTFTLTCSTSNGSRVYIDWFFNQYVFTVIPTDKSEGCEIIEGSAPTGAKLSCFGNIYNVTVTNVTRDNNGDKWRCKEVVLYTEFYSNVALVDVYGKRKFR